MTRVKTLCALIAVGLLSVSAEGRCPAAGWRSPKPMVRRSAEAQGQSLHADRRSGGNTAVFVQTNGVTVVDTKNPGWGQPILAKIKELTNKPVTTIINTHTHGDHVSGNVAFPAAVQVVTHANTR